jgi:glucose-1-phosphate thymidylyltransferase
MTRGEFFIADAFQVMVEEGAVFTTAPVDVWLDCGKPETVLETNQHLLENGSDNSSTVRLGGVTIIPPVFVHPQAKISHSIIGPNATISADCEIEHSIIRDSIVDDGAVVMNTMLSQSLIGRDARVIGRFHRLNVGDSSSLNLE